MLSIDARRGEAGRLIIDIEGRVLDIGDDWYDLAGFDRPVIERRSLEEFLSSDGCLLARQYLEQARHSYGAVFEAGYLRADGSFGRGTIVLRPCVGENTLFTMVIEDAERERQSRSLSQLMQVTVDRLADMIIWLDEDGHYVFVNPAATELLGYTAVELCRMRVWDVDPLFDQQRWRDHWRDLEETGAVKLETVNRSKAGVDIPIEVTGNYVEHEGRSYNCSIVRDISERKAAEAELRSLNARILRLSITDSLTELANRRHFDAVLAREIDRGADSGGPLSLILLDIDSFKAFNDRYGHLEGDDALVLVAGVLREAMTGPRWLSARYGGEEFACILPETGSDQAMALAEALRRGIEALGIRHETSRAARIVTASFGVHTVTDAAELTSRVFLRKVDAALYRAKRAGGNRVEGPDRDERLDIASADPMRGDVTPPPESRP